VLLAVVSVALILGTRLLTSARIGMIVVSAFIAHSAWHWTIDRVFLLGRFPWPRRDALVASGALSWLIAAVAVATALWVSYGLRSRSQNRAANTHAHPRDA
jgi:hypothetical protein